MIKKLKLSPFQDKKTHQKKFSPDPIKFNRINYLSWLFFREPQFSNKRHSTDGSVWNF